MLTLYKMKNQTLRVDINVKVPFAQYFCKHTAKLLDPPITVSTLKKAKSYRARCERCSKIMQVENIRLEAQGAK